MAKQIKSLEARDVYLRAGREVPTLTRKQHKARAQHKADTIDRPAGLRGYKAKVTLAIKPHYDIWGGIVGWSRKG
tara:strand:+ start:87 stop:311 length:225 start_codon:yes stop_codon:yes gene_type:complete